MVMPKRRLPRRASVSKLDPHQTIIKIPDEISSLPPIRRVQA
jgi:hypothetical protein